MNGEPHTHCRSCAPQRMRSFRRQRTQALRPGAGLLQEPEALSTRSAELRPTRACAYSGSYPLCPHRGCPSPSRRPPAGYAGAPRVRPGRSCSRPRATGDPVSTGAVCSGRPYKSRCARSSREWRCVASPCVP